MVLAAFIVLIGCASAPVVENDVAAVAGVERTYEVFGMDCPGCHGGLENLATAIPGVLAAKASWKDKQLVLTVAEDADVSDATVREAVSRANFSTGARVK